MIRVLIADDHGVVRAGLAQLLVGADDLEVVARRPTARRRSTLARASGPTSS